MYKDVVDKMDALAENVVEIKLQNAYRNKVRKKNVRMGKSS